MAKQPCPNGTTIVFACSGGANVGQVANQAAVDLHREGIGSMLCLARVSNCNEDMPAESRDAERIVGIDGCSAACARKTLEQAGLPPTDHVVVTDLGLEKKIHDGILDTKIVTRVKNAVKARLESIAGGPFCS